MRLNHISGHSTNLLSKYEDIPAVHAAVANKDDNKGDETDDDDDTNEEYPGKVLGGTLSRVLDNRRNTDQ